MREGGGVGRGNIKAWKYRRSDSFSAAMVPESLLYTSCSFLAIVGSLGQGALGNIPYRTLLFCDFAFALVR
jgi:hypothetical protein